MLSLGRRSNRADEGAGKGERGEFLDEMSVQVSTRQWRSAGLMLSFISLRGVELRSRCNDNQARYKRTHLL